MGRKNIIQYVCVCVLVIACLQGGSSELTEEVAKSEQIPQASEVINPENTEEVSDNAGLEEHNDIIIDCPVPEPPKNGFIIGEVTRIGAVLQIKCHDGYSLEGHAVITCERTKDGAQWNPDLPTACLEPNSHQPAQTEYTKEATEPRHSDNKHVISPPSLEPSEQRKTHQEERTEKESAMKLDLENTRNLPSSCLYKPAAGPCGASIIRYYFSKTTMECYKFKYGGCDGNSNNFETLTDCNLACLGHE